jgi:hypothetical protein
VPLSDEFAQHKIIGRFVNDAEVKSLLERCRAPVKQPGSRITGRQDIPRRNWRPANVIAIDGSHFEVPYEKGFPGAELGFVSIASVFIDIEQLDAISGRPTIDPVAFSRVESANTMTVALPSANMVVDGQHDARSSFRHEWEAILLRARPDAESETLLETYQALLAHKPKDNEQKCPLMGECSDERKFYPDPSKGRCACGRFNIYSTDILRIHERFTDTSSNGETFGEVMRVLEHLWLVAYLRAIEQKAEQDPIWWSFFENTAFVVDGSLAVFGHPAWLSQAIKVELHRINSKVKRHIGNNILVFGIEKSGRFFDHLIRLDQQDNGSPDRLDPQTVVLLDDTYIKRNIVISDSMKPHGKDTYYGRPFLYKTKSKAMIVGISAILDDKQDDRSTAEPEQFPRLGDMLDLLDKLVSMRYPNAVIPLISAHAEAAIPLRMGEKVLDKLARKHLGAGKAS